MFLLSNQCKKKGKMRQIIFIIFFCLIFCLFNVNGKEVQKLQRFSRGVDINLSAEHDDKEDDTELALEAIANLWRSKDGDAYVEGTAKIVHRSNSFAGNTHYSANLHYHQD